MYIVWITELSLLTTYFSFSSGLRPFVDHPTCPRRYDLLSQTPTRICMRKCLTDANCNGRPHRRCLCDGACGKSCVKWRNRCPPLEDIDNGSWQLVTSDRVFGAVARYACEAGFMLSGPAERVCRADGMWSGMAPTCETEGKCLEPPIVENAVHDGNASQRLFPLGTQLNYKCKTGFHVDGVFLAMCVGNGRWIGPRIKCSPRRCSHPGEIPNGFKNGTSFVYPNRVTYSCVEGYELIGRPYRVCQADGHWSGTLPECAPISCETLSAPLNGQLEGNEKALGAVVRFKCDKGFQLVGSASRQCLRNGTWSGLPAQCTGVDCGKPGPFPNGYFVGGQQNSTVGTVIEFRCMRGKKFDGNSTSSTCLSNGKWSHAVPICWGNCELPTIMNGSVIRNFMATSALSLWRRRSVESMHEMMSNGYVQHGAIIGYTCDDGFSIATVPTIVCYNGTWLTTPLCVPASCHSRPPDLKNGIIRFHTMRHGDMAQHQCDSGFQLRGDEFATCQYGNWTSNETPVCINKYCEYPGNLSNGRVMLIGVTSKFIYRKYMRHVGHNEQIEYQCESEFNRIGPPGATCIDGNWSPPEVPTCELKRHPNSYYTSRGHRDVHAKLLRKLRRSAVKSDGSFGGR